MQMKEKPKAVSAAMGLNWQEHVDVKRDNIKVSRELITKVFSLLKPDVGGDNVVGFNALNGDFSVVILRDVKAGDPKETSSLEVQSITSMLGDSLGAGDYQNYQDVMVRKAQIERI
jgi:hypothetical protein